MPTTDCATDTSLPPSPSEELQIDATEQAYQGTSKPLRGLFFGFAATVTVALALATWYLCVRIVAADQVPAPRAIAGGSANSTTAPPLAPPQVVTPETVTTDSMGEAYWYTVPPVELYLQVAGLGPKQDADFVMSLQSKGFRAQIQMQQNRNTDNARILIGPYSTRTELEQGQRKLQSQGVLAVETAH
jgi:hypothetical protein